MSMIRGLRRDPLDHAVAGADEVVLEPEVGEERDEHRRPESTSCRPDHRDAAAGRRPATAAARPALVRRPPRRRRRGPPARAARDVSGPIETTGSPVASAREGPRGRGGREEVEVAVGRSVGPELARPVERDEVGAERARQQAARALGGGEQHPAGGSRELREEPLLRRDGRDEVGAPERLGRGGADRRDARHACRLRGAAARARRSRS